MIRQINQALLPVLQGVTVDGEPAFVDVLQQPPTQDNASDFSGFPSACYYYETTESDYSTVSENRRDYNFSIYVYGIWANKPIADQFRVMYGLVDAVLDALDKSGDLGLNDIMLRPVPGEFRRIATEWGEGLSARIRVRCSTDIATY